MWYLLETPQYEWTGVFKKRAILSSSVALHAKWIVEAMSKKEKEKEKAQKEKGRRGKGKGPAAEEDPEPTSFYCQCLQVCFLMLYLLFIGHVLKVFKESE